MANLINDFRITKSFHVREQRFASFYLASTVTFSEQLHKEHSKVRTSRPFGFDTTPVSVIGPWHIGHGGRSISMRPKSAMCDCDIVGRLRSGGSTTLSVTGSGQEKGR